MIRYGLTTDFIEQNNQGQNISIPVIDFYMMK